jgi:hypothetical protein
MDTLLILAALTVLTPHAPSPPLDHLTRPGPGVSARISSASPDHASNRDNRYIKPGETFTIADIEGPGVVRHIWLTFAESGPSWLSKDGCADPSEIVVRMYWDGGEHPAVEAPLGDFFACGFGRRAEVNSMPVVVGGAGGESYNCFWPMPFFRSARLTLTNESSRPLAALYYHVDYTKETPAPDAAYFCAQYRQEFPTKLGGDYLIADIEAPRGGHYVGTVMSVRSRSPQWFGEGDEKFQIDGEARPSLWGTGTEDYFLNAWGMEKACYPMFGVTQLDGWLADLGQIGTMYRWHLDDPVRFTTSLRFTIEHAGWMSADETTTGKVEGFVEREDDFATVAFWYQRGQPKRFTTLPSAAERRLPSIDTVVEGKVLLASAKVDGAALSLQAGQPWTGEGQVFIDAARQGATAEFAFDVPGAPGGGERLAPRVVVLLTHSYDFGIYRLWLDGEVLGGGELDFYSKNVELRELDLGDRMLAAGKHILKLECVGKSPASKGWKLGLDSVRLRERWNKKRPPMPNR